MRPKGMLDHARSTHAMETKEKQPRRALESSATHLDIRNVRNVASVRALDDQRGCDLLLEQPHEELGALELVRCARDCVQDLLHAPPRDKPAHDALDLGRCSVPRPQELLLRIQQCSRARLDDVAKTIELAVCPEMASAVARIKVRIRCPLR